MIFMYFLFRISSTLAIVLFLAQEVISSHLWAPIVTLPLLPLSSSLTIYPRINDQEVASCRWSRESGVLPLDVNFRSACWRRSQVFATVLLRSRCSCGSRYSGRRLSADWRTPLTRVPLYECTKSPYLTYSISPRSPTSSFSSSFLFLYSFRLLPFFAPSFARRSNAVLTSNANSNIYPRAKIIVDFFRTDTSSLRSVLMCCISSAMRVAPKIAAR